MTVVESLPVSTSKSSGRVADKLGLRTWFLDPRTWTLGFSFEAFKTTCMDEEEPLREAAFPFMRMQLILRVFNVWCL